MLVLIIGLVVFISLSSFTLLATVPFWGTVSSCKDAGTFLDATSGNYLPQSYVCETKYRFWINFGSDCYYAYGTCPAQ